MIWTPEGQNTRTGLETRQDIEPSVKEHPMLSRFDSLDLASNNLNTMENPPLAAVSDGCPFKFVRVEVTV